MIRLTLLTAVVMGLCAQSAFAQISPGSNSRIGSQPLVQSPSTPPPESRKSKRKVDDEYAHGRAIVAGKARGLDPVQVCVEVSGQLMAMLDTRSHELRAFGSRSALTSALHDCSSSGQPKLGEVLAEQDVAAVVHFLDQRLDLELEKDD